MGEGSGPGHSPLGGQRAHTASQPRGKHCLSPRDLAFGLWGRCPGTQPCCRPEPWGCSRAPSKCQGGDSESEGSSTRAPVVTVTGGLWFPSQHVGPHGLITWGTANDQHGSGRAWIFWGTGTNPIPHGPVPSPPAGSPAPTPTLPTPTAHTVPGPGCPHPSRWAQRARGCV